MGIDQRIKNAQNFWRISISICLVVAQNKFLQRKFVKEKKNPKKEDDVGSNSIATCKRKDKAKTKCLCVAYENLRASQEEFSKSQADEQNQFEACDGAESLTMVQDLRNEEDDSLINETESPDQIGSSTIKRRRNSLLEEGNVNSVSVPNHGGVVVTSCTSELTLSFEGEDFVFPAVTPEKVQAVLLLLGGRDVLAGIPSVEVPFDESNKGIGDTPKLSNLSRRIASLVRFREKRKERCFDKKIRCTVRKEVAQRMHRKNGQFASLKESPGSSTCDSTKSFRQDGTPHSETLRRCQHGGASGDAMDDLERVMVFDTLIKGFFVRKTRL